MQHFTGTQISGFYLVYTKVLHSASGIRIN
jgi:hypothetical protein